MVREIVFDRSHECRDRAFHVGGAATVEITVAHCCDEWIGLPPIERAGRNNVGVSGEADERTRIAASRPQIRDTVYDRRFTTETERRKARSKQRLASGVLRRGRATGD